MSTADRVREHWPEHLGLIVSAGAFVLIVARVFAISGFDPETADAVVSYGGASNIALGTALSSVQSLIALMFAVTVGHFTRLFIQDGHVFRPSMLTFAPALVIAVILLPFFLLSVAPLVFLLAWLFRVWVLRHPQKQDESEQESPFDQVARVAVGVSYAFLLIITVSTTIWLPTEAIHAKGSEPFTGYVLSDDHGYLNVLTYHRPHVVQLNDSNAEHTLCHQDPGWLGYGIRTISSSPYPRCP